MNVQRGRLVSGGRIQVPADVRRELGLADGDAVTMRVSGGALQIRPVKGALARVQARIRRFVPQGVSLADELIAERRIASQSE